MPVEKKCTERSGQLSQMFSILLPNVQYECPQRWGHFLPRVLLAYTSFFISLLYWLRYLFMYGLHLLFTES